ncbi:MAG: protein BatD [Calditrichaeota bacterium]|nr:MAG: protein BatD [Calditrichota bacterium]
MKKSINETALFILMHLICCSTFAAAQSLSVRATVNQTQIAVNQQLAFNIELVGEGAQKVNPPELPDMGGYLTFLGSGGTSQNISFVNGKMSVSKSFSYYYLAVKAGSFTIPAVDVIYDGKTYSSQPITLNITATSSPPATVAPSSNQSGIGDGDDLFLRAIVSKKRVYQNEPVFITFRIYAAVSVTGYAISAAPSTTGFWVEEIESPQQPAAREEVINGKKYVTADIKKIAIFPTSPGQKTLGPMTLQCEVKVQTRRSRDIFDSFFDDAFFGRTTSRVISSPTVAIDVLSLPSEGRPAEFDGAVGQYKITAELDRTEAKTDDAVTLKLKIAGSGNIRMITKPKVAIPTDFQTYDPNVTENITRESSLISGEKIFEHVLIPRFPGEQRIKPIRFAYFDPEARQYKTAVAPELVLRVTQGSSTFTGSPQVGLGKEEVQYVGQDIRYIKLSNVRLLPVGYRIYNRFTFFAAFLFPFISIAVAFMYKKHVDKLSGNEAYARSRKANAMAMRRLSRSKSLLEPGRQKEFYGEVSNALVGFAADKLNLSKAGIISSELEQAFKSREISEELTHEYVDLIHFCDFQRFAPTNGSKTEMENSYQTAKQVIVKLEKAL